MAKEKENREERSLSQSQIWKFHYRMLANVNSFPVAKTQSIWNVHIYMKVTTGSLSHPTQFPYSLSYLFIAKNIFICMWLILSKRVHVLRGPGGDLHLFPSLIQCWHRQSPRNLQVDWKLSSFPLKHSFSFTNDPRRDKIYL